MRPRRATAAALAAALSLTVFVTAALAASSTYNSGPLSASFSASTTRPNCKQLWPVTISARWHGRPANASAYYQFLYNGTVVSTQQVFAHTRHNPHNRLYSFHGSVYDNTFGPFGALAVGHQIEIRAVVQAGSYRAYPGLYVNVTNTRGCTARH